MMINMFWRKILVVIYFCYSNVFSKELGPTETTSGFILEIVKGNEVTTALMLEHSTENGIMTFYFYGSGYCYERTNITDLFLFPNTGLSSIVVYIGTCKPTNTTYGNEFKAPKINTSIISTLSKIFKLKVPLPRSKYTKGMEIQHLSIEIKKTKFEYLFNDTQNYFETLTSLKSMNASGIQILPLPKTMSLVRLSLSDGSSITEWGNCGHLEQLSLTRFTSTNFPKWPQSCTKLEYLEIDNLLTETAVMVIERMIAAAPSLHTLKVLNCRLHNLPIEMIGSAKNLVHLGLSGNVLYDELFQSFPFSALLRTLILNNNLIRGYGIGSLVAKLPKLVKLALRNEKDFISDCSDSNLKSKFIDPLQNSSVEFLDLGRTEINLDCFEGSRFMNIKHITLFHPLTRSPDDVLKLIDFARRFVQPHGMAWFPHRNGGRLELDFENLGFSKILLDDDGEYEHLRREDATIPYKGLNLTVLVMHGPCHGECQHRWLARALRDFPHIISMPTLLCDYDYRTSILETPREKLECDLMDVRNGCVYRRSWQDGKVTAECDQEAWVRMEPMYPLHGLNVSEKGVLALHTKLPDTLQWLDLRRNLISRGNAEQAAALFVGGRSVWLADNLLLCDCENRALLDAIQQHQQQVQDYDLLKCVGTGEALSSVSTSTLCQIALIISLSVIGLLVVVAGVIVVLLRRYGEPLRMFLYSRGWCTRFLQKQDVDDKPYDAFISFAHEDREYVMGTLLPGLENAPERFRICVHYRDWLVGDWIPAQIMRSVQLSKRTLLLLSRSFVVSAWSSLELRYALANAEEEPTAKVLILIKDDVLDMDLDIEFKKYITFNTYLRCDDPWFWEKLRYFLPHRVRNKTASESVNARTRVEEVNVDGVVEHHARTN